MPELDVVGLSEITELLGIAKRTASRYTARPDFPQPAAQLAMGPIWYTADVRAWIQTKPVKRGRPPRNRKNGN